MSEPATDKQKGLLKNLNVEFPPYISKKDAAELINETLNKPKPTQETSPNPKSSPNLNPMFVAYAKDIFIAIAPKWTGGYDALMDECVNLVKRAKDGFKE